MSGEHIFGCQYYTISGIKIQKTRRGYRRDFLGGMWTKKQKQNKDKKYDTSEVVANTL